MKAVDSDLRLDGFGGVRVVDFERNDAYRQLPPILAFRIEFQALRAVDERLNCLLHLLENVGLQGLIKKLVSLTLESNTCCRSCHGIPCCRLRFSYSSGRKQRRYSKCLFACRL